MNLRYQKLEILSVEDNPADSMMIATLFESTASPPHLNFVEDGVEAMDYLRQRGRFKDRPRPDMILLDLNLPKKDGREVLREIKEDPNLRCIPVMILSTSNAERDAHLCYELYANAYFTKPNDLEDFRKAIKTIEDFWHRAVLPHSGPPRATHNKYRSP
jgi:chemotaxis family two-component system response regulator Rcp1